MQKLRHLRRSSTDPVSTLLHCFFNQILAEFRDVAHAVGKLEQTHVVLEVGMPCRAFFRMDLAEWGPFVKNGGQAEEMFQETDGRMSSNCL